VRGDQAYEKAALDHFRYSQCYTRGVCGRSIKTLFVSSERKPNCRNQHIVQNKEYSNWEERFEVIVELDPSQYSYFLEKLSSVKGQPFFNPPGTDFGLYVIRITYIDGEEEFISCDNNAYLRPGKELRYDTYWFSDKDGFDQLIQEFIVCGTEQDSVS